MTDKQQGKESEPLYTHYKLELKNMTVDWDYTICDSLEGVMDTLKYLDIYLDDDTETSDGEPRSVTITGIGMTRAAYKEFLKSIAHEQSATG